MNQSPLILGVYLWHLYIFQFASNLRGICCLLWRFNGPTTATRERMLFIINCFSVSVVYSECDIISFKSLHMFIWHTPHHHYEKGCSPQGKKVTRNINIRVRENFLCQKIFSIRQADDSMFYQIKIYNSHVTVQTISWFIKCFYTVSNLKWGFLRIFVLYV